jgi:phosphonopyruvate decarboxylase
MKVESFLQMIEKSSEGAAGEYFTGVPDSLLAPFCEYLLGAYGIDPKHHLIAANEGNAVGLAAGYHLSTSKIPIVYMQNSGEGNIVNPVASLMNDKVYGIPCIFIVGWRGEPGVHDEPQHVYQGEITCSLLDLLDISWEVISAETTEAEIEAAMKRFLPLLKTGKQVAFVIKKKAFSYDGPKKEKTAAGTLIREEAIRSITKVSGGDPIVSTTGKASRELFEIRTAAGEDHEKDFLTVGSMGHCSSIALSIATFRPESPVWIIDGDGAALMHMGAMPVIASCKTGNLIHIVLNNGAHATVGGQPTVAGDLKLADLARDCGYPYAVSLDSGEQLEVELEKARALAAQNKGPVFMEIKCGIGARDDLGRPTTSAEDNKIAFMKYLQSIE